MAILSSFMQHECPGDYDGKRFFFPLDSSYLTSKAISIQIILNNRLK